jgi:hypothetical protein
MPISRVRFRVDTTPDTDSTSDLTAAITSTSATSISVQQGTDFEVNQNVKIGSEEMTVTNIASNTLTVVRGVNGTTATTHNNTLNLYKDDSPTYTPTQNPNIGSEVSKTYDGIIVQKALGGKTYTFANHESSRRQRRLIYENISESNKNRLVALHDYAKGQKTFFQYSEDGDTWYAVRFVNNKLPVSETAYNVYRVEINIEEQL